MVRVGSYEAKAHLPRLLQRVADGEHIIITKHGKPVAKLVPVEEKTELSVEEAIQEMKNFLQKKIRLKLSFFFQMLHLLCMQT